MVPKRAFAGLLTFALTYVTSMICHLYIDDQCVNAASILIDVCYIDILSIVYHTDSTSSHRIQQGGIGGVLTFVLTLNTSMIYQNNIDMCSVNDASILIDVCYIDILSIVYHTDSTSSHRIQQGGICWCIDVCIDV